MNVECCTMSTETVNSGCKMFGVAMPGDDNCDPII